MKKFITGIILSTVQGSAWDYKKQGADWPAECTGTDAKNQSPINLISHGKEEFNYPLIEEVKDDRRYFNQASSTKVTDAGETNESREQLKGVSVTWNGHTSQVELNKDTKISSFQSSIPMLHYLKKDAKQAGVPITFQAQQFHFHAPSEHTVDGELIDLEMHTVHHPQIAGKDNGEHQFAAAALGILFSVSKSTANVTDSEYRVIDNFFESLQWDDLTGEVIVSNVAYGNLINIVDFNNRWVYEGSVTTPPCATSVFWNEVSTIYPVSTKHLNLFKNQLKRAEGYTAPDTLDKIGNYREVQKIDNHNVKFVYNPPAEVVEEPYNRNFLIASIIFLVMISIVLLCILVMAIKMNKMATANESRVGNLGNNESAENSSRQLNVK